MCKKLPFTPAKSKLFTCHYIYPPITLFQVRMFLWHKNDAIFHADFTVIIIKLNHPTSLTITRSSSTLLTAIFLQFSTEIWEIEHHHDIGTTIVQIKRKYNSMTCLNYRIICVFPGLCHSTQCKLITGMAVATYPITEMVAKTCLERRTIEISNDLGVSHLELPSICFEH